MQFKDHSIFPCTNKNGYYLKNKKKIRKQKLKCWQEQGGKSCQHMAGGAYVSTVREHAMEVPQNLKSKPPTCSSNPTMECISKGDGRVC